MTLLTAHRRLQGTDKALATMLAAIAGCANAGGFMVFGQYTSHMTGYLSQLADNIALQNITVISRCILAIVLFVCGSASAAILINWARHSWPRRQYAYPIRLQGILFLVFPLLGFWGQSNFLGTYLAQAVLCFSMGLQNATITKISGDRIRTTHMTGVATDIGIELGKLILASTGRFHLVKRETKKLRTLMTIISAFFLGGVVGAFGYGYFSFYFALPSAILLLVLSLPSPPRK
jgi:uncharacterized membrane protein YoaK (UPF0700 family)